MHPCGTWGRFRLQSFEIFTSVYVGRFGIIFIGKQKFELLLWTAFRWMFFIARWRSEKWQLWYCSSYDSPTLFRVHDIPLKHFLPFFKTCRKKQDRKLGGHWIDAWRHKRIFYKFVTLLHGWRREPISDEYEWGLYTRNLRKPISVSVIVLQKSLTLLHSAMLFSSIYWCNIWKQKKN